MTIEIRLLSGDQISSCAQIDNSLLVDSVLDLSIVGDQIRYDINDVAPYSKQYPKNAIDYASYLDQQDKAIYLGFVDGELAGRICLSSHWNCFGYVNDIAVDAHRRRNGLGKALLQQGITWAKDQQLAGVMAETQANNVPACRLYERCGFTLQGFDRSLYQGLNPDHAETALFWYLVFPRFG